MKAARLIGSERVLLDVGVLVAAAVAVNGGWVLEAE